MKQKEKEKGKGKFGNCKANENISLIAFECGRS